VDERHHAMGFDPAVRGVVATLGAVQNENSDGQ
jgi:hypothetical protein